MKYIKNQSGSALILTLLLVMAVAILGTALLFSVTSEITMNRNMEQNSIATYLAEAGIDHGLDILENTSAYQNPIMPAEEFKLVDNANEIRKYQIIGLTNSLIRSKGSVVKNGVVVSEVIIEATIDSNGTVSVH